MLASRRSFITGLISFVAAPAIVRVTSLMPVRGIIMDLAPTDLLMSKSVYEELCDITRRAFVPRLYVQLYDVAPAFLTILAEPPLDNPD